MSEAGLKLDPPELFEEYLGCGEHPLALSVQEVQSRLEHVHPLRLGKDDKQGEAKDLLDRSAGLHIKAI